MKKITLLICFLLTVATVNAQIPSYVFSQSNGVYTPITGGTVVATATAASGAGSLDDVNYSGIPIPFTFTYDGVDYTNLTINTNGHVVFGTAGATTNYTPISSTGTYSGAISAAGRDLNALFNVLGYTGEIRYETIGTAPNQTFVIQYSNFRPYSTSTSTTTFWRWNFQIRLNESTNVVEIVYDYNFVGTPTASNHQTGLRGANNTFATNVNNRLITSGTHTWATSVVGTTNASSCAYSTTLLPVSGLTYSWTPPLVCTGTPTGGVSSPVSQVMLPGQTPIVLNVTGQSTGASGFTYQWEESTDGGSNWADATGGTGATTLSYTPPVYAGTPIDYRLRITCTNSGLIDYSTVASLISCSTISSLPWTENFDGLSTVGTTNFPSCWLKENGDWSTSNATTYNTPRSGANYLRDAWTATNEYIWTVGFDLTAGESYDFSTFVQGDGGTGWNVDMFYNTTPSSVGATQLGASYAVPGTGTYSIQGYAEMKRTFVPSSTGTYYFAVRVNQPSGAPWYVAFDDFKLEITPACPSPTSLVVNGITDNSADIAWDATTGNYEYVLDQLATDPSASGTTLSGEIYNAVSLAPSTTYYFHVRTDCGGTYSTWSTISFTTLATPPSNDDCGNATPLIPGGVFSDNVVDGTNEGATTSSETTPVTCGGFSGGDVWFMVEVPASGSLTIETGDSTTGATGLDTVFTVYSGVCGALTQIDCDDDSSATGSYSLQALTGLTPGETLYIRVYEYLNDDFGGFGISAYDASLSTGSFDSTSFKAYPNPVKDVLNLSYSTDISSIEVYNMLGQNVISKFLNTTQGQIDLSTLNAGNYIVKVIANGDTKTFKIVKL